MNQNEQPRPEGLTIIEEAITPERELDMLGLVLAVLASTSKQDNHERSRVRRYGWSYLGSEWLGAAPGGLYPPQVERAAFDSVTVNEYPPGHGIGPHLDSGLFGEPVWVLGLGCSATMRLFEPNQEGTVWEYRFRFEPRTLVGLAGAARWAAWHALEPDNINTRWSVVYRRRKPQV